MHTALARKNRAAQHAQAPMQARAHASIRNILHGPSVQPKLKIGAANDPAEREADAVADKVMRMPAPEPSAAGESPLPPSGNGPDPPPAMPAPSRGSGSGPNPIRRMCTGCEDEIKRQPAEEDKLEVQRLATGEGAEGDEEELVQPKEKPGAAPALSATSESAIRGLGGGAPLARSERAFFEPRFGREFSGVRIHTGAAADTSAKSINARAFTLGSNIAFASGEYTPGTPAGRRLLAHELTHTVQQRASGVFAVQRHSCLEGEGPPGAEPPIPDEAGPHPLIYKGVTAKRSRRPSVGDAQELLNRFLDQLGSGGFACGAGADLDAIDRIRSTLNQDPLEVDCRFGPNTEKVTKMFQRCVFPNDSDEWDGKIGETTWPELVRLRPAPAPSPPAPTPAPTPAPPPSRPPAPPPATPPFTPQPDDSVCDRNCQGEFHDCMDPANEGTTREECESAFAVCIAACESDTGPEVEAPGDFCVPYPNTRGGVVQATVAAVLVDGGLTPLFAVLTSEAAAIKDAYLAGPKRFPAPRTTFDTATGSPLAESFRDHNISESDRDDVADLVESRLTLPPLVHVRSTWRGRELSSDPVRYSTFLNTADRTRNISWNDLIPSDPELLAGGVGRSKGGPDSRTISGQVTRVRDEGLFFDSEELVMTTNYHIRETFGFCPGNPAGAIAQTFTIPLSRLEVTSFMPHDDQPYDVRYSYNHTKDL